MTHVREMLRTHPSPGGMDLETLTQCVQACYDCAQSCTACADACLSEEHVGRLTRCIRLNLDCFDACVTTGNQLSRQTEPSWDLLGKQVAACAEACRVCGEECERHATEHEHCRVCADACRQCEEACNRVLEAA